MGVNRTVKFECTCDRCVKYLDYKEKRYVK